MHRTSAVVVAGLSALALGGSRSQAEDGPSVVQRPKATTTSRQLIAHIALFRRARRPNDALPTTALDHDPLAKLYGVNAKLSRRALGTTTSGGRIAGSWLVPGNDAVCQVLSLVPDQQSIRFVSSCSATTRQATTRGAVGTLGGYGDLRSTHRSRVYGFMPDGVRTVRITTHDGTRTNLPVRHNAFTRTFTRPVRAQWTVAGTRRSLTLITPDDPG